MLARISLCVWCRVLPHVLQTTLPYMCAECVLQSTLPMCVHSEVAGTRCVMVVFGPSAVECEWNERPKQEGHHGKAGCAWLDESLCLWVVCMCARDECVRVRPAARARVHTHVPCAQCVCAAVGGALICECVSAWFAVWCQWCHPYHTASCLACKPAQASAVLQQSTPGADNPAPACLYSPVDNSLLCLLYILTSVRLHRGQTLLVSGCTYIACTLLLREV
jgi:hypothetical protein